MSSPANSYSYSFFNRESAKGESSAIRGKVFSQIDNLNSNDTYQKPQAGVYQKSNQDKIAQIKKKYENVIDKSSGKKNEGYENYSPIQFDRAKETSHFTVNEENYRKSQTQIPTDPIYNPHQRQADQASYFREKQNAQNYHLKKEIKISDSPEDNFTPKCYNGKLDFSILKNQELRKQLQSNRSTLSVMKSELQSKLNQLNMRTNANSALKISQKEQGRQELKMQNRIENKPFEAGLSYEAIISKYSKKGDQKVRQSINDRGDQLLNEIRRQRANTRYEGRRIANIQGNITSKYIQESYKRHNDKNNKTKEDLSRITQVSNSNNSETIKEPTYDFDQKIIGYDKKRRETHEISIRAQDKIKSQTLSGGLNKNPINSTKNAENNQEKGKWFKNVTSFLDEQKDSIPNLPKQQYTFKKIQKQENGSQLEKLDNAQGFVIKRTVTEENFMILNKANRVNHTSQNYNNKLLNDYMNQKLDQVKPVTEDPSQNINYRQVRSRTDYLPKNTADSKLKTNLAAPAQIRKENSHFREVTPQKYSNNIEEIPKQKPEQIKRLDLAHFKEKYNYPSKQLDGKRKLQQKQFRQNENLSRQIEKIDKKIRQFEQNKKDLNITFKHQEMRTTSSSAYEKMTNVQKSQQIGEFTFEVNKSVRNRTPNYLENVKPMYSEQTLHANQSKTSAFSITLFPVENVKEQSQQSCANQVPFKPKSKQEYLNRLEIENRAGNGIEERKKLLQDKFELTDNLKRLVKVFCQQAVLDEQFRNSKIWFHSACIKENKWEQLKRELKNHSISISDAGIKQQFQIMDSENNPFFSVSDSKCDLKSLVQTYTQAKKHWEEKIARQFSKDLLEKEGLNANKIDLEKKGQILVEDFVRFLNIQSGTFLRNRDVSIIMRRIQKGADRLTFNHLMNILCEK